MKWPWKLRETRSLDTPGLGWIGLDRYTGGGRIGPERAQQVGALSACIQVISTSIAALPASIYRDGPDGQRVPAPEHPAAALLTRPNGFQTWNEWLVYSLAEMLLHGNSVSQTVLDSRGAAVALVPIPWTCVRVNLLSDGTLTYSVTGNVVTPVDGFNAPPLQVRTFPAEQILHLKDRPGESPYIGQSRISRCSDLIDAALIVQDYARDSFRNQARPAGIFRLPPSIDRDAIDRVESWFKNQQQGRQVGNPLFLEAGCDWVPMSGSSDSAQVLQSRQWAVLEVARLMGVPPILIGDTSGSTFTNSEQSIRFFANQCLLPIIVALEASFDRAVIAESGVHLTLDMSGLVRGSYVERNAANVANVNAGIMTPNDARADIGLPPLPEAPDTEDATDAADPMDKKEGSANV